MTDLAPEQMPTFSSTFTARTEILANVFSTDPEITSKETKQTSSKSKQSISEKSLKFASDTTTAESDPDGFWKKSFWNKLLTMEQENNGFSCVENGWTKTKTTDQFPEKFPPPIKTEKHHFRWFRTKSVLQLEIDVEPELTRTFS